MAEKPHGGWVIETENGNINTANVVNAAGEQRYVKLLLQLLKFILFFDILIVIHIVSKQLYISEVQLLNLSQN